MSTLAMVSNCDEALKELFAKWTEGYEYVPPMLTCPLGFHAVDCLEREESTKDKGGNCTDWSLWWMDLRLANADRPREELIGLCHRGAASWWIFPPFHQRVHRFLDPHQ